MRPTYTGQLAGCIAVIAACAGAALGQSVPTPGLPSIPLTGPAAASLSLPGAGITYQYGIEFVTIPGGSLNNQPWPGNGTAGDRAVGRGAVAYDYRIGRFEVTTAQWVAFFNAAYDRPQSEWLPHLLPPSFWGAVADPNYHGPGRRWIVPPGNEMRPVGNISWRMAAMYANFLHNDQSTARESFLNGAYDVSTFGSNGSGFTDQFTHNPGARFWIPTWDEWLMAAHYDPNRHGPGLGGWWLQPNAGDAWLNYGPPGVRVSTTMPGPDPNGPLAQANAGWPLGEFGSINPFTIRLGAYPTVQSPWGLFDLAGGTTEWTEEIGFTSGIFPTFRRFDGSPWESQPGNRGLDLINFIGGDFPSLSTFEFGFRIAAAVPAPSSGALLLGLVACAMRRRRQPRE